MRPDEILTRFFCLSFPGDAQATSLEVQPIPDGLPSGIVGILAGLQVG